MLVSIALAPTEARIFSAQFPFFGASTGADANPASGALEDYSSPIPQRASAFSNNSNHHFTGSQAQASTLTLEGAATSPQSPGEIKDEAGRENRAASPFNLQFAEADPFQGDRPLQLSGGYDPQSQQWAFADGAGLSWSWYGGYDTNRYR